MLSERPHEDDDRAVPRHWEGDLIIGTGRSAIGTVVERTSRYTLLVHLPRLEGDGVEPPVKNGPALSGYGTIAMKDALEATLGSIPEGLVRSLSWDRGKELLAHTLYEELGPKRRQQIKAISLICNGAEPDRVGAQPPAAATLGSARKVDGGPLHDPVAVDRVGPILEAVDHHLHERGDTRPGNPGPALRVIVMPHHMYRRHRTLTTTEINSQEALAEQP